MRVQDSGAIVMCFMAAPPRVLIAGWSVGWSPPTLPRHPSVTIGQP
jgi:hypothetical protein